MNARTHTPMHAPMHPKPPVDPSTHPTPPPHPHVPAHCTHASVDQCHATDTQTALTHPRTRPFVRPSVHLSFVHPSVHGCVCVCVCARARVHVHVRSRVLVRACVRARSCVCVRACVFSAPCACSCPRTSCGMALSDEGGVCLCWALGFFFGAVGLWVWCRRLSPAF